MEETFVLVMLSLVMLVGSYMAGSIPLVMKLSEDKLKFMTVLGAGLLVGTALAVIIPEGIRSLYLEESKQSKENLVVNQQQVLKAEETIIMQSETNAQLNSQYHHGHSHGETADHSQTIGLSLVLGFVFMMLIDQISIRKRSLSEKNITATIGLVVHAAADGVALGAAATTSQQDVEIIVFLAIMLHKAPAAFGLVSFLLHEQIDRQQIRKHLAIFSLSAPTLALLTFFGIGQEQKETLNSVNATGIAMLFSAGTFLYVATVHVLPELTQMSEKQQQHPYEIESLLEGGGNEAQLATKQKLHHTHKQQHAGLGVRELICMVCGAFLPLLITFKHHH